MSDRLERRRLVASALTLAVALVASGCGVSSSNAPQDVGDPWVAETSLGSDIVLSAPDPNSATTPEDLVQSYLKAAVGGGEASITQVKMFLTERAKSKWIAPRDLKNPPITVIRLVGPPVRKETKEDRTRFEVEYGVVGTLTDQGRVDELAELTSKKTMSFWVNQPEQGSSRLRIDEIAGAPPGLLLSDETLTDLYRIQPVYFWDAANSRLVPDLRYLPLTLSTPQRALKILQWLLAGPSLWLTGVQRLPTGTVPKAAVELNSNGAFVVKLSAQAGAGGPDAVRRLYYQLKWSLRTGSVPSIELQIEDKTEEIPGTPDEYLQYNLTNNVGPVGQKFDIKEQRVVALGAGVTPPALLTAKENKDVVFAAINREMNLAAFVRLGPDGRSRTLQIVRQGKRGKVDAKGLKSVNMGRPVWIPGTNDQLIVTSGGHLYVVNAANGQSFDVTPNQVNDAVSRIAVAPDGRRVAFVASGRAYVASLKFDGDRVTVGLDPRRVLAGQLTAGAIAWASESWLYVTGTAGGKPAMWRVTADSVVAENLSGKLNDVRPADVVAHPAGPSSRPGELIVLTTDPPGAFVFVTSLGGQEPGMVAPFFAG